MNYKNGREAKEFDLVIGPLASSKLGVGAIYDIQGGSAMISTPVMGRMVARPVALKDLWHVEDALELCERSTKPFSLPPSPISEDDLRILRDTIEAHPKWNAVDHRDKVKAMVENEAINPLMHSESVYHPATPCCGYHGRKDNTHPVQWNAKNGVIQCHNCGHAYSPCAVPRQSSEQEHLYFELIMAVETVHPGETRHQTALRYIKERERKVSSPAQEGSKNS